MEQSSTPHVTYWNTGTRLLHWGMALTVSFQLLISLIMEQPKPGRVLTSTQALSFELHEWVGLAAVGVIIAHWVWSALLTRDDSGFRHLFPWDAKGRAKLLVELRQILRFQLPQGGTEGGLAGLVHGLGFLAVSAMAATGAVLFLSTQRTARERLSSAMSPIYIVSSPTSSGFTGTAISAWHYCMRSWVIGF